MQEYIDKIKDIAHDYHRPLNDDNITAWINQFDEDDREFLLQEVIHILNKTYVSQDTAYQGLGMILDKIKEKYTFTDIGELLENVTFLSCQVDYKSQSLFLNMLNEITNREYSMSISINDYTRKYWIYIDDNLASGGTFFNNINTLLNDFGIDDFLDEEKVIYAHFFYSHLWGQKNTLFRIRNSFSAEVESKFVINSFLKLSNNPKINHFNINPRFDCAHIKDLNDERTNRYLDSLPSQTQRQMYNIDVAFRPDNKPSIESFFTSKESRDRYEKIILNKGLDIIERIENCSPPLRPLGLTTPSHQTLGLGSHVFTWRNTSNTCPLVYWWGENGWSPLFPVQHRGNNE